MVKLKSRKKKFKVVKIKPVEAPFQMYRFLSVLEKEGKATISHHDTQRVPFDMIYLNVRSKDKPARTDKFLVENYRPSGVRHVGLIMRVVSENPSKRESSWAYSLKVWEDYFRKEIVPKWGN